jgi:PAB1-binding protein PBP1
VDSSWLSAPSTGLESSGGNIGNWDQFSANEKFGVKTTYSEDLYTTKLDASKITDAQRRKADKLAGEINKDMTGVHGNIHMMEERGMKLGGDYDEEDLYSGVLTEKGGEGDQLEGRKNIKAEDIRGNAPPGTKYVPPNRRGKSDPPPPEPAAAAAPAAKDGPAAETPSPPPPASSAAEPPKEGEKKEEK